MNRSHHYLVCVLALAASNALAAPVVCELGKLTRTIEVVYANPGQALPCEVLYDKSAEGSIETLWRASNEAGYCEEKAAALADRLGSLGWRCTAPEADPAPAEEPAPVERLGDVDQPG